MLSPLTIRLFGGRLAVLEDSARAPGDEERDEGDTDHHLDTADYFADCGRGYDVAVADRGDRLESPPDSEAEGGKVVCIGDAHHDRSDERESDERRGQGDRDGSCVRDALDTAIDE